MRIFNRAYHAQSDAAIVAIDNNDPAGLSAILTKEPKIATEQRFLIELSRRGDSGLVATFLSKTTDPNPLVGISTDTICMYVGAFGTDKMEYLETHIPLLAAMITKGNSIGAAALLRDRTVKVAKPGKHKIQPSTYKWRTDFPLDIDILKLAKEFRGLPAEQEAMKNFIPVLAARIANEYRDASREYLAAANALDASAGDPAHPTLPAIKIPEPSARP